MKRILCSFAIILFFSLSYVFGQARVDVITLKNGDVLKGEIVENVPNNYVKIELPGGSMLTVKYSDIEKFSREKPSQQQPTNLPDPTNQTNASFNNENNSARNSANNERINKEIVSVQRGALSVGPKFGLNFATFGGDNASYISVTTKFLFGGFLGYNLAQNFDLQLELLYNATGMAYSINGATGNYSISYLEIVPLAKYNIPVAPSIKIFVVAGPQLGIKLSAYLHQNANSTDTDCGQYISGADFDIVLGTGVSFKLGPGSLITDLRYNIGLSNVNKTSPPSNTNQVFSWAVGYAFDLN
jgi:hypothetical protein